MGFHQPRQNSVYFDERWATTGNKLMITLKFLIEIGLGRIVNILEHSWKWNTRKSDVKFRTEFCIDSVILYEKQYSLTMFQFPLFLFKLNSYMFKIVPFFICSTTQISSITSFPEFFQPSLQYALTPSIASPIQTH